MILHLGIALYDSRDIKQVMNNFSAGLAFKVAAVLHSKDIDVSSLFDSIEVPY